MRSKLDMPTLESWLWDAACSIRGPIDAPKFKDYILPLLFYKRLCDVYEDELKELAKEYGDLNIAEELAKSDRKLIRFYIPDEYTWREIRKVTTNLGEGLTLALREISKENPKLQGVIDIVDFNATAAGQRIIDDGTLARLMEILNKYKLGLDDVEPDILGRAYEYLLRKFAEGSGQSAGEFYTPREVAILMARLLDAEEGEEVYDPACGSGGLLIKAQLRLKEKRQRDVKRPLRLYGQEINPLTYAMARMNAFIHDMDADIRVGDTIRNPRFVDGGKLRTFEKVTANPMWNQKFPPEVFETDPHNRFLLGIPPSNSTADWGWIQHMYASLRDRGKLVVVIDLTEENIAKIEEVYKNWQEVEVFSKIITIEEAAKNDYNLSPSRYVATGEREEYLPVDEALVQLAQVEEERREIEAELNAIVQKLGFERYLAGEE